MQLATLTTNTKLEIKTKFKTSLSNLKDWTDWKLDFDFPPNQLTLSGVRYSA